jgi:methyl-accepting chemotaxis protein
MKKSLRPIYEYWLNWNINDKITSTLINVTLLSIVVLIGTYYVINTRNEAEQTGEQWIILGNQILMQTAEKVTEETKLLETLAKTPSLVNAVIQANLDRKDWSPAMIQSQDRAWTDKDPAMEATVGEIGKNETSAYLIDFLTSNPEEVEVFVTDIRGLNIGMTDRTSDFLQADENWWKSTFADGNGATYLAPVEYDESAKSYAMDIGIPILDPETKQTIGILRGTLDISVMINALKNVEMGSTGNIVLIDRNGIVLYSRNQQDFMKPAPDFIPTLFQSGQSNWTRARDMTGKPAVVAYSTLDQDLEGSLGWRILLSKTEAEANQAVRHSLFISLLAAILAIIIGTYVSRLVVTNSIASPLENLTKSAHELSLGNIAQNNKAVLEGLKNRKDEIGEIERAFDRLTLYFQAAAAASTAIANRDLSIEVTANSEKDMFGNAYVKMVSGLRETISQVAESADSVSAAASQLASSANGSGKATNQIATTIQQVALGTVQQTKEVSKTSGSVEQMNHVIESLAQDAEDQALAIQKAAQLTININTAIEQVSANAQASAHGARQAAESAQNGTQTVEATIAGMQTIKTKVGMSMQKVREMGKRSEQIDTIVETIDDIAAQTNLLALNAAIEAARVQSKGEKTVEDLIQQHMLGAVNLITDILATGRELHSGDLEKLASLAQVPDFCISDADGVITATNKPGSLGFRFSENPRQESSVFRPLLSRRDGVVVRPIVVRDQDHRPYIYVGVSRRDRPGIVQAGSPADSVYSLGGYSRGFAVVANEVGKLAEHAKTATKEVAVLIRDLQKTVKEVVLVMEDGTHEVDHGSARAAEASEALSAILKTAELVSQQVEEIATAIQHMSMSSTEMVHVMETVSSIVEKNTAAAKDMAANSTELTQAVENIASVSEENSAAVEEVSASTEEVLAQAEQVATSAASLMEMAKRLQKIVNQFSIANYSTDDLLGPRAPLIR